MSEKIILDVRTPKEYKQERIKGSIDIPLSFIESREDRVAKLLRGKDVLIMCRSGRRAEFARQILLAHSDIDNLKVYKGGIIEYKKEFPNEIINDKLKFSIPIIQQVQIITGLLIFIFAVLGLLVNTLFFIGAIVIGIGLTISGFTGFCGLAKLPFNK